MLSDQGEGRCWRRQNNSQAELRLHRNSERVLNRQIHPPHLRGLALSLPHSFRPNSSGAMRITSLSFPHIDSQTPDGEVTATLFATSVL